MTYYNTPETITTRPSPIFRDISVSRPNPAPIYRRSTPVSDRKVTQAPQVGKPQQATRHADAKPAPTPAITPQAKPTPLEPSNDSAPQAGKLAQVSDSASAEVTSHFLARKTASQPAMTQSLREIATMLNRDIPRVLSLIDGPSQAYPDGYLGGASDLAQLLRTPVVISIFKAAHRIRLTNVPLHAKLPVLPLTRTAYILSSLIVTLEDRGMAQIKLEADILDGESDEELQFRVHNTLTQVMNARSIDADSVDSLLPGYAKTGGAIR